MCVCISRTAVDIVGLEGLVFQSISTETKMKRNPRETEEVRKSLEEKERAGEERGGGSDGEGGGGVTGVEGWVDAWRDEADFWPGVLR